MKNLLNKYKVIILIIGIIIFLVIFLLAIYYEDINKEEVYILENEEFKENETKENKANENEIKNNEIKDNKENIEKIAIHITGEIKKPGIVYLNKGSRIADAIEKAGGKTEDADIDKVNLAYVLEDGQKIYIPNKKDVNNQVYIISDGGDNILIEDSSSKTNVKGVKKKVNINLADQTELESLPGIGESLAERIIKYRNENGKFKNIEDIQNVKGIGDSKYNNIKSSICIE